jgi:hypothetical protein
MLGRGVNSDVKTGKQAVLLKGFTQIILLFCADGRNHYTPFLVGGKTVQTRQELQPMTFFQYRHRRKFCYQWRFEYSIFDGTVYRLREGLAYKFLQHFKQIKLTAVTFRLADNLWFLAPNVPKYTHFDPDINSCFGRHKGLKPGRTKYKKRC